MRRLLKYELESHGETIVESAPGLRPLAVGFQGRQLVVWVEGRAAGMNNDGEVEPEREYRFMVVWTGEDVPDGAFSYVGTASFRHQDLGDFVIHVYYGGIA
jgi:hypothetical protein